MNRGQRRRECEGCGGGSDPPFIHNVRQRGVFRRLCTDCLLKNHQGLFCPVCLHVFEDAVPPPHARLICLSCPSITHLSCSSPTSSSNSSAASCFTCPPCSNPNFSFFTVEIVDSSPKSLDKASAKALVAAAKIAAGSMTKAAMVAKKEADKRVREAAVARKRAREALEHVQFLYKKKSG